MQNQTINILDAIYKLVPYLVGFIISLLGYIWNSKLRDLKKDFEDLKKLIEQEKEARKEEFKQHEKYYELFFETIKDNMIDEKKNREKELEKYEKWFIELNKIYTELLIKIEKIDNYLNLRGKNG